MTTIKRTSSMCRVRPSRYQRHPVSIFVAFCMWPKDFQYDKRKSNVKEMRQDQPTEWLNVEFGEPTCQPHTLHMYEDDTNVERSPNN